ncbi:unnamed protein product, partial [Prunus brigantina]
MRRLKTKAYACSSYVHGDSSKFIPHSCKNSSKRGISIEKGRENTKHTLLSPPYTAAGNRLALEKPFFTSPEIAPPHLIYIGNRPCSSTQISRKFQVLTPSALHNLIKAY